MIFNHDTWWSTFFRSTYFINFDFWNHLLFWKWTVWLILKGMCWLSVFYQKLIIFLFSHFFSFRKLDQRCWTMREKKYLEIEDTSVFYTFCYIQFEITVILAIPLALISVIYSWITPFFALNCITLFPSHWKTLSKTQQPIRFQGLFMVTNQIRGLRKKENFCNF